MQKPFRFGIVSGGVQSRASLFAKVRRAEELGYATWSMADHVSGSSSSVTTLAMAAAVTTSLRIGSCVFCHAFRHPVMLAHEVATLDQLSEGRFELGLGPGYVPTDYHQIGLPFEDAGARISRFEEAVRLIKYCLTQPQGSFSGTYYPATGLDNRPLPLQQPHPPLYIGGGGKRMLQFAAREADIVGIGPKHGPHGMQVSEMTLESTTQKVAWVREAAAERFDQLELNCALLYVRITDQPSGEPLAEPSVASRWGVQVPSRSIYAAIGSIKEIIEELQARREEYGISYIQVTEPYMEAFAPVVARLTGH